MVVVGNGQLANTFKKSKIENTIVFASGVSDSKCTDKHAFDRETKLLKLYLEKNPNKKFVYFSSSALSSELYERNEYYRHKNNMEILIQQSIKDYYIFRVPQLFGKPIHHKTLINYLYEKIVTKEKFIIYSKAYRYVIFIDDLYKIVDSYVKYGESRVIFDVANPYKYSIYEIVKTIEKLTNKKAIYDIEEKEDAYNLDLSKMLEFLKKTNINMNFGNKYLFEKLSQIVYKEL